MLDFQFGCSANAEAIMPSPQQFTYFQGAGFDCSLLSFMQIDKDGSVNVSRLAAKPHVTAGCGVFDPDSGATPAANAPSNARCSAGRSAGRP